MKEPKTISGLTSIQRTANEAAARLIENQIERPMYVQGFNIKTVKTLIVMLERFGFNAHGYNPDNYLSRDAIVLHKGYVSATTLDWVLRNNKTKDLLNAKAMVEEMGSAVATMVNNYLRVKSIKKYRFEDYSNNVDNVQYAELLENWFDFCTEQARGHAIFICHTPNEVKQGLDFFQAMSFDIDRETSYETSPFLFKRVLLSVKAGKVILVDSMPENKSSTTDISYLITRGYGSLIASRSNHIDEVFSSVAYTVHVNRVKREVGNIKIGFYTGTKDGPERVGGIEDTITVGDIKEANNALYGGKDFNNSLPAEVLVYQQLAETVSGALSHTVKAMRALEGLGVTYEAFASMYKDEMPTRVAKRFNDLLTLVKL